MRCPPRGPAACCSKAWKSAPRSTRPDSRRRTPSSSSAADAASTTPNTAATPSRASAWNACATLRDCIAKAACRCWSPAASPAAACSPRDASCSASWRTNTACRPAGSKTPRSPPGTTPASPPRCCKKTASAASCWSPIPGTCGGPCRCSRRRGSKSSPPASSFPAPASMTCSTCCPPPPACATAPSRCTNGWVFCGTNSARFLPERKPMKARVKLIEGVSFAGLTSGSLVQFGWGSKQRRIQAAETDRSSAIAESIAQDKDLTKKLLDAAGAPVPNGRPVKNAEDAWAAAQEIGGPVVVKPLDGNQGKGVAVNIETREQVLAGYAAAAEISEEILVERYVPGYDFRILVGGKQMVAAARRDPPQVIGDGVHTVRELVEQVNSDPRRSEGHATSLSKIRLDDIALATLAKQNQSIEDRKSTRLNSSHQKT